MINVAIEGQFLTGAFLGALVGTIARSAWIGLIAAIAGGVLVAALLAVLAIRYLVDQVVLGVLLILLATGLTAFLYGQLMQTNADGFNSPPLLPTWSIPGLSRIPVLGPSLFQGNVLLYLAIVLVPAIHVALFHTRWGLRTRSVGEHPDRGRHGRHQRARGRGTATCCSAACWPASAARSSRSARPARSART